MKKPSQVGAPEVHHPADPRAQKFDPAADPFHAPSVVRAVAEAAKEAREKPIVQPVDPSGVTVSLDKNGGPGTQSVAADNVSSSTGYNAPRNFLMEAVDYIKRAGHPRICAAHLGFKLAALLAYIIGR